MILSCPIRSPMGIILVANIDFLQASHSDSMIVLKIPAIDIVIWEYCNCVCEHTRLV